MLQEDRIEERKQQSRTVRLGLLVSRKSDSHSSSLIHPFPRLYFLSAKHPPLLRTILLPPILFQEISFIQKAVENLSLSMSDECFIKSSDVFPISLGETQPDQLSKWASPTPVIAKLNATTFDLQCENTLGFYQRMG